ncbi:MAG: FliM/FliN family flagellar motor switch protein [Actinomycetia bacterium]|nr:FliM/FliN family flagellar motor switch protein [Actinomycetes bacterium]
MVAIHEQHRQWEEFDLGRPKKLTREELRPLDGFHEAFAGQLSSGIGRVARSVATVELACTAQLTWEEYLRTLPAVTALITVTAPPLPGQLLIEMDTPLSLALASRLLGGRGTVEPPRRPSDMEVPALRRISAVVVDALDKTLNQALGANATMESLVLGPHLLATAAPSQMALVLTYSLSVPPLGINGDVNVVMSLTTVSPMLDKLQSQVAEQRGPDLDPWAMNSVAQQVPLELQATLKPTRMLASSVAALVPGDVIVLDHRAGESATVSVGSVEVLRGHLGRRGARLAIAVSTHAFDTPAAPRQLQGPTGPAGPHAAFGPHGYSQVAHEVATADSERQHDARDAHASASSIHSVR